MLILFDNCLQNIIPIILLTDQSITIIQTLFLTSIAVKKIASIYIYPSIFIRASQIL